MWILMVAVALALDNKLTNTEILREIDLTGPYTLITTRITVKNSSKSPVSTYLHMTPEADIHKLSNIKVYLQSNSELSLKIEHSDSEIGYLTHKISIPTGIPAGAEETLVIEEYFAQKMSPLPKKIGLFDKQLIYFTDNIHYLSPYETKKSTTQLKFPSSEIESYSKPSQVSYDLRGKQLFYGPSTHLPAYAQQPLQAHFFHPKPIAYFTKVVREIEVSHWGSIAVSDWYTLVNRGAEVKGEFSRLDYMSRSRPSAINAIRSLEAILPRSAWGLYYRDEIGNVSTSHARQHSSYVHLEVNPRYPIMGGWKDTFNIGYNLPTKYFLKHKDTEFALNVTFGFPFKEIIAEQLIVKVILPQGSSNIKYVLPFEVDKVHFDSVKSFLDFTGKPVIIFEKENAMDIHRKPFQVHYESQPTDLIIKPLILSLYVFASLIVLIVSFRLDLSLEKAKQKTE